MRTTRSSCGRCNAAAAVALCPVLCSPLCVLQLCSQLIERSRRLLAAPLLILVWCQQHQTRQPQPQQCRRHAQALRAAHGQARLQPHHHQHPHLQRLLRSSNSRAGRRQLAC